MKVNEFDDWFYLPENSHINYEYILGTVIPVVSNSKSSKLGLLIGSFITVHVEANDLGHTTGADGSYKVQDERYIPDVGFLSKARMPILQSASYISIAPDLAVEVVSPTDSQRLLTVKIGNYLASGTTGWVVYPDEEAVDIYAPNQAVTRLEKEDMLDGRTIIPNFKLSLKSVFK